MAINSVAPSSNTQIQRAQLSNETLQPIQAKKAAEQAAQDMKIESKRRTEQTQRDQQTPQNLPPKSVVNSLGQVTGQLLNAVA